MKSFLLACVAAIAIATLRAWCSTACRSLPIRPSRPPACGSRTAPVRNRGARRHPGAFSLAARPQPPGLPSAAGDAGSRRERVVVGDEHDAVAEWRRAARSPRASAARVARSCPSVGSSSMPTASRLRTATASSAACARPAATRRDADPSNARRDMPRARPTRRRRHLDSAWRARTRAPAGDVLGERRAAPLMVRILGREGERAVARFAMARRACRRARSLPRVRREHAREQLEQGRLAGAVRLRSADRPGPAPARHRHCGRCRVRPDSGTRGPSDPDRASDRTPARRCAPPRDRRRIPGWCRSIRCTDHLPKDRAGCRRAPR